MKLLIAASAILILLSACEHFVGVGRSEVNLLKMPSRDCLETVLKSTPGVEFNSYQTNESRKWSGPTSYTPTTEYYLYDIVDGPNRFR